MPALPARSLVTLFLSTLRRLKKAGAAWWFLDTLHLPVAVGAATKFRSTLVIPVAVGATCLLLPTVTSQVPARTHSERRRWDRSYVAHPGGHGRSPDDWPTLAILVAFSATPANMGCHLL